MITNERMAELVVQTEGILRAALRPGHIPINEATFLGSPVAAMVLGHLIADEQQHGGARWLAKMQHERLVAGLPAIGAK